MVWVCADDEPAGAAWHLWHDGAVLLVTGPGEQQFPGLASARRVHVLVRGAGALAAPVGELACAVEHVEPGTAAWDDVAPLLAAQRLNAPDQGGLPQRWATAGVALLRLLPVD